MLNTKLYSIWQVMLGTAWRRASHVPGALRRSPIRGRRSKRSFQQPSNLRGVKRIVAFWRRRTLETLLIRWLLCKA